MKEPSKKTKMRLAAFNQAVETILHERSATLVEPGEPGEGGRWKIETVAGKLHVKPYGNWIACRFANVRRACEHFGVDYQPNPTGLNIYTGKWNFHFDGDGPHEGPAYFARRLTAILPSKSDVGHGG